MSPTRLDHIDIPAAISESPEIASVVERASQMLQESAPPSGMYVAAGWALSFDQARNPILDLNLKDKWEAHASARFKLGELENVRTLKSDLNWLWGDLLQDRSHKQFDQLKQLPDSVEEG